MTDRELMQQALDALESDCDATKFGASEALRARLAQPEQPDWSKAGFGKPQPESKVYSDIDEMFRDMGVPVTEQEPVAWVECDGQLVWNNREAAIGRNLYTAPPQREWQGLTDEEQLEIMKMFGLGQRGAFADAIEAKLKEKNA